VLLAVAGLMAAAAPTSAQPTPSQDIVVSQVYGGGGNSGATLRNDYIELFNRGTSAVDVSTWSVQYASATGNTWQRTNLSGTIQPGQYYLVQQAAGANASAAALPTPDATGSIAMSATAGKVALVTSQTTLSGCGTTPGSCSSHPDVRDFVGYGGASDFEGAGPAPLLTNTTADFRNGEGCIDTNNNNADFTSRSPSPRNSSSPRNTTCGGPTVVATVPPGGSQNVPEDSNITIQFSEPVTATDNAFSLSCTSTGPIAVTVTNAPEPTTTFVLDPSRRLPSGDTCTVTIEADAVEDATGDNLSGDFSFSFSTQGIAGLRIHDIQGRQHLSPFRGFLVAGVRGVVTATRFNGFYIQDPARNWDSDERTSEGIFIFTGGAPPAGAAVGAAVTVSGRVTEFRPGCTPSCTAPDFDNDVFGASAFGNLTTTQISQVTVTPSGTDTVPPTVVGRGGRVPPRTVIDNDTPNPQADDPPLVTGNVETKSSAPGDTANQDPTFDPGEDGIDFYESLEGMLTRVNRPVVVEPTNTFGANGSPSQNSEVAVLADNGEDATVRAPRGPIVVRSFDRTLPQEYRVGDFNPERIILNDPVLRDTVPGFTNDPTLPQNAEVKDRFDGPVDAVVDYSFGNFKFLVRESEALTKGGLTPEKAPPARRDQLSVASYNVENLDPVNDAERITAIATQIRENLRAPDILGLQEVQDNDGEGPQGPNGDASWAALVTALQAQGVTYQYRQIDPVHNADGGAPNSNIRVGFLFRPDRVTFVDRPGGTAVTPTEDDPAQPGAQLTFSPGRVDPNNPVWEDSRKPLAGEFRFRGRKLFVVSNHFNSKGGDAPLFGRFQEPHRPSELQRRGATQPAEDPQRGQAGVLNSWIERLQAAERGVRVIALGDFNDFQFSEASRVLERGAPGSRLEMANLWRFVPERAQYSYIFQGNAQVLDHIFVSPGLLSERPQFDAVHINSEFSEEQQSDHDPPLARFTFDDEDDDDDDDSGDGDDDGDD